MDELKRCPFCGTGDILRMEFQGVVYADGKKLHTAYVKCLHCIASGPAGVSYSLTTAINKAAKKWNKLSPWER